MIFWRFIKLNTPGKHDRWPWPLSHQLLFQGRRRLESDFTLSVLMFVCVVQWVAIHILLFILPHFHISSNLPLVVSTETSSPSRTYFTTRYPLCPALKTRHPSRSSGFEDSPAHESHKLLIWPSLRSHRPSPVHLLFSSHLGWDIPGHTVAILKHNF